MMINRHKIICQLNTNINSRHLTFNLEYFETEKTLTGQVCRIDGWSLLKVMILMNYTYSKEKDTTWKDTTTNKAVAIVAVIVKYNKQSCIIKLQYSQTFVEHIIKNFKKGNTASATFLDFIQDFWWPEPQLDLNQIGKIMNYKLYSQIVQ